MKDSESICNTTLLVGAFLCDTHVKDGRFAAWEEHELLVSVVREVFVYCGNQWNNDMRHARQFMHSIYLVLSNRLI